MCQSFRTNPTLKAVSVASPNYTRTKDQAMLRRKRPMTMGPNVRLPDIRCIKCTAEGDLPLATLFR